MKRIYKLLGINPPQGTFCYCPVCNNELVGTKSFLKDDGLVWYKCSRCGSRSVWDFDFPSPLLLKYQPISKKMVEHFSHVDYY